MPYIKPIRRALLAEPLDALCVRLRALYKDERAGHLNYTITRLCLATLGRTPKYDDYNSVLGALEAAKLELYRRQVGPYEDLKIAENGDVVV